MDALVNDEISSSTHDSSIISETSGNGSLPNHIPILTMILYSFPQLPFICMSTTILAYIIPLYATHYNWGIDQIGTLVFLMSISMTITQPLIGLILGSSDGNLNIKKFKISFIFGSFIFGVGFVLIVYLPSILSKVMQPFMYSISLVTGIGWALYEVSFASIGANLSTNYDVRIELQTWATIFYTLGTIIAHSGHALFGLFLDSLDGIRYRNYILAPIFFIILTISLCLFQIYMNDTNSECDNIIKNDIYKSSIEYEYLKMPLKKYIFIKLERSYDFLKKYLKLISNRYAIALTLMDTSNSIFLSIGAYAICFATRHIVEMPNIEAFSPLIAVVSMILILPFWFKYRIKFNPEKRTSCFFSMLVQTICVILLFFTVKAKNLTLLITLLIIYGFSNGIFHTTLQSMNGDVIDYVHSLNDKRHEGVLFGFIFFIKNGITAIVLKLLYYLLGKYGYTGIEKKIRC